MILIHFFALFLLFWFKEYFSTGYIASVDLPAHERLIYLLKEQLLSGDIIFYDFKSLTGYPAHLFYAPLAQIIAAVLSFILDNFTNNSVILSIRILLLLSTISLPYAIFFTLKSLIPIEHKGSSESYLLQLATIISSFWFINHDNQWFGMGAASYFNVGLFSHGIALPIIIYIVGLIFHFEKKTTLANATKIIFILTILIYTHTLSSIFILFYLMLFAVFNLRIFYHLSAIAACALLLASFWLIPCIKNLGFTGQDIIRLDHNILESVFSFNLDHYFKIQPHNIIIISIFIFGFIYQLLSKNKLTIKFTAIMIIYGFLIQKNIITDYIPLSLHNYRFVGYYCLLLTIPFSIFIYELTRAINFNRSGRIIAFSTQTIFFTILISNPHYERDRIINSALTVPTKKEIDSFKDEDDVINYFKSLPGTGKIALESFNDYSRYPWLSINRLPSRITLETNYHSIMGLFVQSTNGYRFPAAWLEMLGIKTIHIPLLCLDNDNLRQSTIIENLKNYGISHIIVNSENNYEHLSRYYTKEPIIIGRYQILSIQDNPNFINPVKKNYLAVEGLKNSDFFLLSLIFAIRDEFNDYLLIQDDQKKLSNTIPRLVFTNKSIDLVDTENILNIKKIAKQNYKISEYSHYLSMEESLLNNLKFLKFLYKIKNKNISSKIDTPNISFDQTKQTIRINNLQPKLMYELSFSYSPYFVCDSCEIFRASGEKTLVIPNSNDLIIRFEY